VTAKEMVVMVTAELAATAATATATATCKINQ